ncbi:dithiobiotin synthetase [Corynebacterium kutscheri]|uniref:ATP-dependent dethiobiotin synthetase BioD n=1 Tax=Corynebacterium kutscheri TaxID=35755 RepID=A0A0F6R084_9CORY|nr:dethiobiotin synthase [Corynebacterium kutscheri]AKE40283.1 dethiobiotin synthase [Corynebacterium kutscheri]VEH10675.1 dithiobiotin synthetase [Corynebacterium kutscheri]VEH81413.1 dithiobiotin synthetase [Corynebacterium kutscheri]
MIITITGTNTNVGKTIACAALATLLADTHEVCVVKPVQTGTTVGMGDVATVEKLSGVKTHEFYSFPEPLSPHLAARRAHVHPAKLEVIVDQIRALDASDKIVLVEGAGGLLVRLAEDFTIADVARELDSPVIMVTSLGLGSLNAAELSVEAATRRGLNVVGLIGGLVPVPLIDTATILNIKELPQLTGIPYLGGINQLDDDPTPEKFAQAIDIDAATLRRVLMLD